jgi:hypothetical protein
MKNCVTSVCYSQSSGANNKSTLYLGDEQGNIAALTFLQPAMLLFSHKGMETQAGRAETIYWPVRIMHRMPRNFYYTCRPEMCLIAIYIIPTSIFLLFTHAHRSCLRPEGRTHHMCTRTLTKRCTPSPSFK